MKLKLAIVFILLIGMVATALHFEKKYKIEQYTHNQTKIHQAMYDAIYHSFQKRADLTFGMINNDQEIINIYEKLQKFDSINKTQLRDKLKLIIDTKYNILKTQGIDIFHFHLPNNESFFRMHNPTQFGDDLSKNRESVVYVNKYQKAINGFEVGRYFSGYRFIYPLKNNNQHLGSVEISFDLSLYVKEFMNTLDVLSNFRINKNIVDKKHDKDYASIKETYKEFKISGFYAPKKILQILNTEQKEKMKKLVVDDRTLKTGIDFVNQGKAISVFDNKSKNLITFIPVANPVSKQVCGFITLRSDDKYIYNKRLNSYFILGLFTIFTLSGLFFIYREIQRQKNLNTLLQNEVDAKTKELKEINEKLECKVQEEVEKNIKQELKLFEQSKLAVIGDMIANIAHQWRQPLSVMTSIASGIKLNQELGIADDAHIKKGMDNILIKTQYLSETVDTFRNYLKEKKEKTNVILQDRINMAMSITKTALDDNHIELIRNDQEIEPLHIELVPGELTEVIINLVNNARDILLEKNISDPWVKVFLEKNENTAVITIEDNGGGIPEEILPKIFDQYFTTKDDSKGTGLGLHMSHKIITQSLHGKLYVKNTSYGAKFFIELPLS